MDLRTAWQEHADSWVRWARSPDSDDDFWQFHMPHFLNLLPPPGRLTVDVGCGEGRLGRILTAAGHRVIGCDAAFALVKAAAGLAIEAIREPVKTSSGKNTMPFLHLRARRDSRLAASSS